jgi:UDP-N-acetylglucosamine 2-epimerase (non-hydrolysing)
VTLPPSNSTTEQVTHIVGARPNFPKAAPVVAALSDRDGAQRIVHTGQHYDDALSDAFFRELDLPRPDINLGVGSGSHASQTADLMRALDAEFTARSPRAVIVYGDINSTLAATLVAVKMGIPTAHVEAGLRSFDRTMPEEINRLVTDQLAGLLLATSPEAVTNLTNEGVDPESIAFVGNPMIDTLLKNRAKFSGSQIVDSLGIDGRYAVATLHRPANVDDPRAADQIVEALKQCSERVPVIIPLHPRGRKALAAAGLDNLTRVFVIDPQSYLNFMGLVQDAAVVITDSGGVQEETTVLGIPCLTLRPNTERPITITQGTNRLVSYETLTSELDQVLARSESDSPLPVPPLWDGNAGERIADAIVDWMNNA